MRVLRASVALGLAMIAAIAITGSGSSTRSAAIVVGYSSDALSQPAQYEAHLGAVAEAKALGVKLYEQHAPDAAGQASGINDLFAKGITVLAVDANDANAIGTTVKAANAKHIPVVTFVGGDSGGGQVASFVTTDEKAGGYAISVALFKAMGGKGQVAFIQGCTCITAGAYREDGFRKALKQYPGIKLAAYGSTNWDPVKALNLATDMLAKNPNITGIVALTDPMANSAYEAVVATHGKAHALITGYNGVCSALNQIWKGQLYGTLDQNWRGIGAQAVETAVDAAKGMKVPATITMPSYVITKPVMQQIMAGTYPNSTPSLVAAVKTATTGCK